MYGLKSLRSGRQFISRTRKVGSQSLSRSMIMFENYVFVDKDEHRLPRSSASNPISVGAKLQNISVYKDHLQKLSTQLASCGRVSLASLENLLSVVLNSKENISSADGMQMLMFCGSAMPDEDAKTKAVLAESVLKAIALKGKVDISHYNMLLQTFLENDYSFSVTEFLKRLKAEDVEPNRVTYKRLIARYCDIDDIIAALSVIDMMKARKLLIDETSYAHIVKAFVQNGDTGSVEAVLELLRSNGVTVGYHTNMSLAIAHAARGDIAELRKDLLEACKYQELFSKDCVNLILALSKSGHKEQLPNVLEKVCGAKGFNDELPNLILQLCSRRQFYSSIKVFKFALQKAQFLLDNSALFRGVYLQSLLKFEAPSECLWQWSLLLSYGGVKNYALETIGYLLLSGDFASSKAALQLLHTQKVPLRWHYFVPILVHCLQHDKSDDAMQLLLQMHAYGITFNLADVADLLSPALYKALTVLLQQFPCALQNAAAFSKKPKVTTESIIKPEAIGLGRTEPCGAEPCRAELLERIKLPFAEFITRLHSHYKNCNSKKEKEALVEQLQRELPAYQDRGYLLSPILLMYISDMYAGIGNWEKAVEVHDTAVKQCTQGWEFDVRRLFRLATLMISKGKIDGALQLLSKHRHKDALATEEIGKLFSAMLNKTAAVDIGRAWELVKLVSDHNLCHLNHFHLGKLVLQHLLKQDCTGAVTAFVNIAERFRVTPAELQLYEHLLDRNETELLDKAMASSVKVNGVEKTYLAVLACLLRKGLTEQASKIVHETSDFFVPKMELFNKWLYEITKTPQPKVLLCLLEVTKSGKWSQYREPVYDCLVRCYGNSNNVTDALNAWTSLKSEYIEPSPELRSFMQELLTRNRLETSFIEDPQPVSAASTATNYSVKLNHGQDISVRHVHSYAYAATAVPEQCIPEPISSIHEISDLIYKSIVKESTYGSIISHNAENVSPLSISYAATPCRNVTPLKVAPQVADGYSGAVQRNRPELVDNWFQGCAAAPLIERPPAPETTKTEAIISSLFDKTSDAVLFSIMFLCRVFIPSPFVS